MWNLAFVYFAKNKRCFQNVWPPEAMLHPDAILSQKVCFFKMSGRRRQCYIRTQCLHVMCVFQNVGPLEAMLRPDEMCYMRVYSKCRAAGGNAKSGLSALKTIICSPKYRAAGGNSTPGRNALKECVFQNVGPPEAMLHPDALFLFIYVSMYAYVCKLYPYCTTND